MEQLLFNLLKGPLGSMGVSDADLTGYISTCIGYVYAILAILVIAIVVIVVASLKAKKGLKLPINVSACVACLLAVLIVVNLLCFGPLQTVLSPFFNSGSISDASRQNSKDIIEKIGEEGIVLAKNDGLLPLSSDVTKLNVFGWDSVYPVYGGSGSGSADTSGNVGILDALKNGGYSTNETLSKMYTDYQSGRGGGGISFGGTDWSLPEPTAEYYTDAIINEATDFSDVAVIVLGRTGGEGADLPTDMYTLITDPDKFDIADEMYSSEGMGNNFYTYTGSSYHNNSTAYNDFDPGEHYLQLSNTEEDMIDIVCGNFQKVILIVNANNTMELGWVENYPQIQAVLLVPGTGATGFAPLGGILNGSINPSGRTVDTFVADLTATPYYNNIGNFTYSNADDIRQANAEINWTYQGNLAFVNYVEGIYVGYKFYETAAEEGLIDYDSTVVYPFGYGLSYTTFSQEIQNFDAGGDSVKFDVVVTNTGSKAGKDVVEVYYTPPYTNGGIEKASVNLVDFAKTDTLEAGKSQTIPFDIPKEDFAAYDDQGLKVRGGGYILEAGEYTVSIRSDSHTVIDSKTFTVASDTAGRGSDLISAVNQFDYAPGNVTYLSRRDGFANYAQVTAAPTAEGYEMDAKIRAMVEASALATYDPSLYDDAGDVMPTMGAKNGLQLYNLRGVPYDDAKWDQLLDQMTLEEMASLITVGGWQTVEVASVGKVATSDCDGPAGLNNFVTGNYGTGYPAEVLMAQTWSVDILAMIGDGIGREFDDLGNYGWYGPAMNGHRSAFAGRNFEYYSEDSVLAGKLGSAEVNAAVEHGVYPYIKHFALNDQEWNRCAFLLTFSNEQALREIYLRPYEIVVKNYDFASMKPLAVMSAYNWIGSVPACTSYELLTTVLREEWGFVGMVETDYDGNYGYMITDHCVRAGNDLKLGYGSYPGTALPLNGEASATLVKAMRQSCKNILYTIANSGYYANGNPYGGMDNMTKAFIGIDVAVAVVLIAIEAVVLVLCIKKRKAA